MPDGLRKKLAEAMGMKVPSASPIHRSWPTSSGCVPRPIAIGLQNSGNRFLAGHRRTEGRMSDTMLQKSNRPSVRHPAKDVADILIAMKLITNAVRDFVMS